MRLLACLHITFCIRRHHVAVRLYPPHPPTPEIYTLSLHDALPISSGVVEPQAVRDASRRTAQAPTAVPDGRLIASSPPGSPGERIDRKSTRLNSSHVEISYAVVCLKKKTVRNLSP